MCIKYLLADLSSMQETRSLAQQVQQKYDRLDVLINNTGGFFMRRQETVDGLEMTFQQNHLSYLMGQSRSRSARLITPATRLVMRSPEKGAETVVYLATSPEVEGVTGKYFVDMQPKVSSRGSQDPEAARKLWQISEDLAQPR